MNRTTDRLLTGLRVGLVVLGPPAFAAAVSMGDRLAAVVVGMTSADALFCLVDRAFERREVAP